MRPIENLPELLEIHQAAELLRVSETSLRRWTNAGRLACFRVGGRRERRFRRADLLAFMEREPQATPSEFATDPRHAGFAGSHLSSLYTSDLARVRQAVDFLAEVRPSDACFLVATPAVRDRVLALLERRRPSLRRDMGARRFVVSEYARSAEAQLEFWNIRLDEATRNGARSIRVVGDLSGGPLARRKDFAEVVEYEAEYDRSIARRFPAVFTLCLYDARRLSGVETASLFRCHADVFRYPIDRLLS